MRITGPSLADRLDEVIPKQPVGERLKLRRVVRNLRNGFEDFKGPNPTLTYHQLNARWHIAREIWFNLGGGKLH